MFRVESQVFVGDEFESKWRLDQFPWLTSICFSDYLTSHTASLYADREGLKSSKPATWNVTWIFFNQIQLLTVYILYCLLSEFFPLFFLFWQTLTARDDTRLDNTWVREARNSHQNDVTWFDFFAGEASRNLALSLAFTTDNINNLSLALRASHL